MGSFKKLIAGVLAACAFSVQAAEPSKEQVIAASALLAADWLQTRYIARHPDQFFEHNPLLGRHPSIGRVNTHFLGAFLLGYTLTQWGYCNRSCYSVFIALEGANVARNFSIGIKFEF